MCFRLRSFKCKSVLRIYYRRWMIRLGRLFLLLLLIWAFIFIQTLRRNFRTTIRNNNISLSKMINNFNFEEKILNMESYGKVQEDTVIFVVLMDGFSKEFNTFLASLSKIKGIEDAFIVFSHYHYDETLTRTIESVDFCRVLQIFYPYSIKSYSREFQGLNLNDLNKDEKTAQQSYCSDPYAYFTDIHGHYKNDKKHHWWWTANQIFESLKCTQKHTGLAIFMRDNLIFTKDFIYMAMYIKNVAGSLPRCEFVSMGTVSDTKYSSSDIHSAKLTLWDQKLHSSVLAFDVTTWNIIAAHYDLFCDLKDTSWSSTLYYISLHRMDSMKFKVLSSVTPRAYKISPCKWFCDFNTDVDILTKFENINEGNWFPSFVEVYIDVRMDDVSSFDSEESKAMADGCDRALCYNMSAKKIKKVIMNINM